MTDEIIDERDLSDQKRWYHACQAEKAVSSLVKKRMDAVFAKDRKDALEKVLERIPENSVIGFADSATMYQIDLFDNLKRVKPKEIIRPVQWDEFGNMIYTGQDRRDHELRVLTSDVYVCGVNAVTLDGKLVSVDGLGNRVAPMIYGPNKVIIVAGANKIVPDAEAARERVRTICGPVNTKRHFEKHHSVRFGNLPCYKTGFCADCNRPERVCNYTVTIESQGIDLIAGGAPKSVVIVGEELGI
jgi:hypothetical protein